jgi:hypothetical protein
MSTGHPDRDDPAASANVETIDWLLESDPAIRWQTLRDLTDASPEAIAAERGRIAQRGTGAAILAAQGTDGSWHQAGAAAWVPTLYTLLLLRSVGVDPTEPAVQTTLDRLEEGFRWDEEFGKNSFFAGEVEPCINGGTLALGAYFKRPSRSLADRLLAEQLQDGGWNCEAPKSARSSFHTTICVLEGLLEYERAVGSVPELAAARRRGEEYLLSRDLFRRRSTGAVANLDFLQLAFPPRYHYDVLRALDYFRDARARPDARFADAVNIIENRRQPDGRWHLDATYQEVLAVPFDESKGEPSRWNTLRALRVLRWYGRAIPPQGFAS